MKIVAVSFFLLLSAVVYGQSSWKLVYEHDADGKVLSGSLEALVASVQKGETIRIYFRMGDSESYVEHTALAKFMTVMTSKGGSVVTGQIESIMGQVPDFASGKVALKENLEWSMIASTTGKHDQMTRNMVTGEIVNHAFMPAGIRWFVERR